MQTFLKSYIDDTDLSNRSCVKHDECVDKGRRHLAWQYSSICSLSRRGKGGVSNALRVKSGQRLAKKKISPSTPAGGGTLWQLLANKMQTTSSAVGCVAVSGLMKGFFHRHNTKTSSSNYGVTLLRDSLCAKARRAVVGYTTGMVDLQKACVVGGRYGALAIVFACAWDPLRRARIMQVALELRGRILAGPPRKQFEPCNYQVLCRIAMRGV